MDFEGMKLFNEMQHHSGVEKQINSELWHACAGPLVNLPQVGSLVYYFPQGHSEQVAVSAKRTATTETPNYPNLSPQLLCQLHNVILHADKDSDEIYAQMSLRPVNSEKDVIPIPNFGVKGSKHPSELFCKKLTASDTSTHGGFSVPRRAAEKLFPQLDYSMQPPSQEVVVRDLHDHTWTFRHIYRGQPKRHLLTTGWSMFVGAKRLRAGDSLLFVRDEKSRVVVGVRRVNREQTPLSSSVLSADTMHIGILAAAAHAASSGTLFTIFYNPRACPSNFVIPFAKYQKAVYTTQLSVGMKFSMMFETEESSKRRYMGTIMCISEVDPLRWPSSKWRSLGVEWDEAGGCDLKLNRVSPWEVETPENLFIFPSLTADLKRPFQLAFVGNHISNSSTLLHTSLENRTSLGTCSDLIRLSKFQSQAQCNVELLNSINGFAVMDQNNDPMHLQTSSWITQPHLDLHTIQPQAVLESDRVNSSPQYPQQPHSTSSDNANLVLPSFGQELWDSHFSNAKCVYQADLPMIFPNQDMSNFQYSSGVLNDIYSCFNLDGSNSESTVIDPCISSIVVEDNCCMLKDTDLQNPCAYLVENLSSNQDVQSQITSDSRTFSMHEYADNSGGASTSNIDFDDTILQHGSWQQAPPRFRTYTKIQKSGSVGRSIDVACFRSYQELGYEIEHMFGLESLLNDTCSGWKLVYVDFENDVLLVGDDPWEEFVGCVKCIRILSPSEVQQMGEEGMQLLNSVAVEAAKC